MEQVSIHTEYITLGQLVKYLGLTGTGGGEKEFLATHVILINRDADSRRGRKIRVGDLVTIDGIDYQITTDEN